ncbi:hypothetical protein PHYSODRAFT_293071 [Phytophthora sojae]|uniref:Uncharacterized protein n=1 Tax=Phytophthora sojae (strain P6497) TaxID=1094619 RepID=G4YFF3_PHYSP|nr:hypothetical protein PHYSODRAFT_293071 [Phytophthora sojae]EGZ26938.1 hypothetical protein PHYSODRAFT_293071 [Phytophthora sojae]|eukprot:XP_009514213.1 hypothetical protein PHYSODRAFT_293071 [Phytophthora sojae]
MWPSLFQRLQQTRATRARESTVDRGGQAEHVRPTAEGFVASTLEDNEAPTAEAGNRMSPTTAAAAFTPGGLEHAVTPSREADVPVLRTSPGADSDQPGAPARVSHRSTPFQPTEDGSATEDMSERLDSDISAAAAVCLGENSSRSVVETTAFDLTGQAPPRTRYTGHTSRFVEVVNKKPPAAVKDAIASFPEMPGLKLKPPSEKETSYIYKWGLRVEVVENGSPTEPADAKAQISRFPTIGPRNQQVTSRQSTT